MLPTPRHPPRTGRGAAQTSRLRESSQDQQQPKSAERKLTRKTTKGRCSGQAGRATLKSRAKLKQGALTNTLTTAAAPSAVSGGLWGCYVARCQQPRHQLRNCAFFQELSAADRESLVCLHHLCRKCLEPDHWLRGSACRNTAVGSEEISPNERCKRKHVTSPGGATGGAGQATIPARDITCRARQISSRGGHRHRQAGRMPNTDLMSNI
jgi:hypothetical protein